MFPSLLQSLREFCSEYLASVRCLNGSTWNADQVLVSSTFSYLIKIVFF